MTLDNCNAINFLLKLTFTHKCPAIGEIKFISPIAGHLMYHKSMEAKKII